MSKRAIRRILLLRLPSYVNNYFPPLAMGVLTSFLRSHRFDVEQHDLNGRYRLGSLEPTHPLAPLRGLIQDKKRIRRALDGRSDTELQRPIEVMLEGIDFSDADVVLLSSEMGFIEPAKLGVLIAKAIKEKTDVPIVVGGEAQQFKPIDNMFDYVHERGYIDYEVHGPGENALLELIAMLEGRTDPAAVPGLVWMDGARVTRNPFDMSTQPIRPDFKGLALDDYAWRPDEFILSRLPEGVTGASRAVRMLPVQFIIGCPNRCAFCTASAGIRLNAMKPREAVAMLADLVEAYDTRDFYFLHPTLNISKKFIHELCDEIIRTGLDIRWTDCARVNHLDAETVAKMHRAGAVRLVIGMETASERLLKVIGKQVTVPQVEEAFRICHEEGIYTSIEIITGLPGEKEEDVQATVDFLHRNDANIDEIWINRFFLENNSRMFRQPGDFGITNVRHVRKGDLDDDEMFYSIGFAYIFDEAGGLKWEAKLEQIERSFQTVVEAAGDKEGRAYDAFMERPSLLLYLGRMVEDPDRLREILAQRDRHITARATRLSADRFIAKLREVRSVGDLKRLGSKALGKVRYAIRNQGR